MFAPKTKCIMYSGKDDIVLGSYDQGLHYPSIYTIQHYDPNQNTVRFYNAPEIDFSVIPEGWGFSRALAFQSVWWKRKFITLELFLQQSSPQLSYYNKLCQLHSLHQ